MRYRGVVGFGAVVFAGVAALAAEDGPALADARRLERALQAAVERAEPAVACLLVQRRDPERATDPSRPLENRDAVPDYYGSGVVIDEQGSILTHYHVVRDATVYVRLPGYRATDGTEVPPREGYANIYAADNRSDLAVLKMSQSQPARPYAKLTLGEGEKLRKGSMVLTLGHPYAAGYRDGSPSASWGIVSNLRRRLPGTPHEADRSKQTLHHLGTLIQTDARLQLGSSGGALLDLDGKLVGLTTAQAALTGIDMPGGFAVPIDANLRRIIEVLLAGKEVEYGFLGVSADPGHDRPRAGGGVLLEIVVPNSPAARAGLQMGDVILQVNGHPIREHDDLFLHLGAGLAGRPAELLVQRRFEREPRAVTVVLAKSPVTDRTRLGDFGRASVRPRDVYGLRVEYTSVIHDSSGAPILDGVVVREVLPNTAARSKGLTEYVDVITEVNDRRVNSPVEFYAEAEKAKAAGEVRLTLRNPPRTITLP